MDLNASQMGENLGTQTQYRKEYTGYQVGASNPFHALASVFGSGARAERDLRTAAKQRLLFGTIDSSIRLAEHEEKNNLDVAAHRGKLEASGEVGLDTFKKAHAAQKEASPDVPLRNLKFSPSGGIEFSAQEHRKAEVVNRTPDAVEIQKMRNETARRSEPSANTDRPAEPNVGSPTQFGTPRNPSSVIFGGESPSRPSNATPTAAPSAPAPGVQAVRPAKPPVAPKNPARAARKRGGK